MLLGKRPRSHLKRTTSMKNVAGDLAGAGNPTWNSGDYAAAIQSASFLRVCALCKSLLLPGRDIFMYRGEIAFCSRECREQQIKLDERKEKAKCSFASMKISNQTQTKASASDASAGKNGEMAAAG